jgi:hypothetical protein
MQPRQDEAGVRALEGGCVLRSGGRARKDDGPANGAAGTHTHWPPLNKTTHSHTRTVGRCDAARPEKGRNNGDYTNHEAIVEFDTERERREMGLSDTSSRSRRGERGKARGGSSHAIALPPHEAELWEVWDTSPWDKRPPGQQRQRPRERERERDKSRSPLRCMSAGLGTQKSSSRAPVLVIVRANRQANTDAIASSSLWARGPFSFSFCPSPAPTRRCWFVPVTATSGRRRGRGLFCTPVPMYPRTPPLSPLSLFKTSKNGKTPLTPGDAGNRPNHGAGRGGRRRG